MVRNGTQGVGACIAKGSGVRLCADAKAVQHDQKTRFFHNGHSILRAFPGTVLLYYPYYKQKHCWTPRAPEIRLKDFKNGVENLVAGQTFTLTTRDVEGTNEICSITYKDLPMD